MSATIATKDLKFVIFGSGHDYTRTDSGTGEGARFFSHPYVPLNSYVYAGQFYFLVTDENGNPIDAVKDDIAHCTFTPAIGSTFNTEGTQTVGVDYYREYTLNDETFVVEKHLTQEIEVVNHGTITRAGGNNPSKGCYCWSDIYADGYCFIHPESTSYVGSSYVTVWQDHAIKKLSSFQWRVTKLAGGSNGCFRCKYLEDISELEYADTSNVTAIDELFMDVTLVTDWTPISKWDVSNVTSLHKLFVACTLPDLTCISAWNVSNVTNMSELLYSYNGTSIHGLENWNVGNVANLYGLCYLASYITSLAPLLNWNVSKNTTLEYAFDNCQGVTSLHGLENWDVSKVTNLHETFYQCYGITNVSALANWNPKPTTCYGTFNNCTGLASLLGLENFDLSNCTDARSMFNNTHLKSLNGIGGWDVSKVQTFGSMFGQGHWIESLEPIEDWQFDSMQSCGSMFGQNSAIIDVSVDWTIPVGADISGMFNGMNYYYSTLLGIYLYKTAYSYVDYDGHSYGTGSGGVYDDEHPLQQFTKDASGAENWTSGSSRNAFNDVWSNRPTWN